MKRHYTLSGLLLCLMTLFTLSASAAPDKDYLCFTANTAGSKVRLIKSGTPTAVTIEYSTDGGSNWTGVDFSTNTVTDIITLDNVGDKVYFRNAKPATEVAGFSTGTSHYYYFFISGSIAASGNVMSLVDQDCATTTIPNVYCFCKLFTNCSALTTAPAILPATTLKDYCYREMFNNCTTLTSAPVLPATTLVANCYQSMFGSCKALTTAPELPATTLANNCYQSMFDKCSSLTTAPELPATMLAASCYQSMFNACTALTTAPELPATTLTKSCYQIMFGSCQKLVDLKVAFAEWTPSNATMAWVSLGTGTKGTFTCPKGLPQTSGNNYIPVGWTNIKNTYDLTITSETGWASLCVNLPLQVPAEDVAKVYYASAVDGSTIELTQIEAGTVMAAKTAVIVKGTKGATVSFPVAGEAGTSFTNLFQGSSVDKACNAGENYVLNASMSSDDNVHFSIYTGTKLTNHKAWLPMSAVSGASSIQFRFGDATAISSIETEVAEDVIYNLAGQRVGSDYRGLVIKNGKKTWNN